MRKWYPAIVIFAGYAFSAAIYSRLPDVIIPRWEPLIPFGSLSTEDAIPRLGAALGLPTLALVIWLLLLLLASPAGERFGRRVFPSWVVSERTGAAAVDRFEPTFVLIITGVVAFMVMLHVVTLGTAIGWPDAALQVFTAIIGLGLVVLGNVMPRTRPNWIAGLRTKRTLSDPDVWRRTHRVFGAVLMLAGIAMIAASVVAPRYAAVTGIAGFFVAAIAGGVRSVRD